MAESRTQEQARRETFLTRLDKISGWHVVDK
jgi:hypothetical protein